MITSPPSALESSPKGWTDLTADGLKQWKRVPIPPKGKLKDKSPWSWDASAGVLLCEGKGTHEMLLFDRELGDGIFHVDWRFRKVEGKKGYNSGVYVRNSADGAVWHQAQVGSKNVGHLFGKTRMGDKLVGIPGNKLKGPQRGKEAGEWNVYEITSRGPEITLWVNGAVTARWTSCPVPRGFLGLEAEGWVIEFRNLKYKALE